MSGVVDNNQIRNWQSIVTLIVVAFTSEWEDPCESCLRADISRS